MYIYIYIYIYICIYVCVYIYIYIYIYIGPPASGLALRDERVRRRARGWSSPMGIYCKLYYDKS